MLKIKRMEEVFKFGQMDQDMMDFGEMEWLMALVVSFMLKVMYMKVNGLRIKQMVMVYILISMVADTKVNGSRINSMVLELNNGLMEQNMKVSMNME